MPKKLQLDRAEQLAKVALAKKRLYHYVKLAWNFVLPGDPFVDGYHLGCIAEHLQAVTAGQLSRLVINVPPRHTKSLEACVFWFTWTWLQDPTSDWLFASYDTQNLERDSVRCRDLIKNDEWRQLFGVPWGIKSDMDAKDYYVNTLGGERSCTTPEGRIAGVDVDYFVADDIHNVKEARQPRMLKQRIEWLRDGVTSRSNDPTKVRRVLIGQRIAEEDLYGYARQLGYETLILPLEYEPRRYFESWDEARAAEAADAIVPTSLQQARPDLRDPRTQEGDILWPQRFTRAAVEEIKAAMVEGYAGQYQQRPAAQDGDIFKAQNFRRFRTSTRLGRPCVVLGEKDNVVPLDDLRFFQTIDTAATTTDKSAYTVVATIALTPASELLVWHVFRARLEVGAQYGVIRRLEFGPGYWLARERAFLPSGTRWPKKLLFQAVEDKSTGIGLIQTAAANGRPFKVLKAGRIDKVERAVPLTVAYENGRVYHRDAPWVADLETELKRFPNGARADQVDVLSYAAFLMNHDQILRRRVDRPLVYTADDLLRRTFKPDAEAGPDEQWIDQIISRAMREPLPTGTRVSLRGQIVDIPDDG